MAPVTISISGFDAPAGPIATQTFTVSSNTRGSGSSNQVTTGGSPSTQAWAKSAYGQAYGTSSNSAADRLVHSDARAVAVDTETGTGDLRGDEIQFWTDKAADDTTKKDTAALAKDNAELAAFSSNSNYVETVSDVPTAAQLRQDITHG